MASGEQGIYLSSDAGRRWRSLRAGSALLAWPGADRLYAVASDGSIVRSGNVGASWRRVGNLGGQPAAFEGESAETLYVALHDGTIKRSTDGGGSWSVCSTP